MDIREEQLTEDPREAMISLITNEMRQAKRKLAEIKDQIEQTEQIVEREQQRYTGIATEIRTMEENLDTTPRADIRDKYTEAIDSKFRLATMQGQLEKFRFNYDNLEKQQLLLSQLLNQFNEDVELFEDGQESQDGGGKASINIVRMVNAQEDERQRLANRMHDGPAQSLTNFILQAEICQRLFDRNPERAAEELDNLKTAASVTFQKVRDFIFDLRPMMLDDLGVIPTVRRHVDSFKDKNDMDTELEILGDERRLEKHHEVMIFRAVQDLMALARDNANANKLSVTLDMSSDTIKVSIEDDGRTFNAETVFNGEELNLDPRVKGLITIKEKFELVDGSMSVTSIEGTGTIIKLDLPTA
jgi:two-component system, NarL family, sensor histidine kinase DegS